MESVGESADGSPSQSGYRVASLLDAMPDLEDYGTAWANRAYGVTIPKAAREKLELPAEANYHLMGSPGLRLALLIAPRRSTAETLQFLLDS